MKSKTAQGQRRLLAVFIAFSIIAFLPSLFTDISRAACGCRHDADSFLLLPFRQPARRVVRLAVQLLHLFHEARPVIALGVRERPRLAFIVPAFGVEPLRLFVMSDRGLALAVAIKIFG